MKPDWSLEDINRIYECILILYTLLNWFPIFVIIISWKSQNKYFLRKYRTKLYLNQLSTPYYFKYKKTTSSLYCVFLRLARTMKIFPSPLLLSIYIAIQTYKTATNATWNSWNIYPLLSAGVTWPYLPTTADDTINTCLKQCFIFRRYV